jgi:4-hydroxybenzoate polyprenyltransferase
MDKFQIDLNTLLAGFIGAFIGTDWKKIKHWLQGVITVLSGTASALYLTPIMANQLGWEKPHQMIGLSFLLGTLGLRTVQAFNLIIEKSLKKVSE